MTLLTFKTEEVAPLVRHAMAATAWRQSYADDPSKPAGPALWLVGDQGVYLVSNGEPLDWAAPGRLRVAYAKGFDPNTDDFDDWWEAKRALSPGGDFVETLPWCKDFLEAIEAGRDAIQIEMTPKRIRFA